MENYPEIKSFQDRAKDSVNFYNQLSTQNHSRVSSSNGYKVEQKSSSNEYKSTPNRLSSLEQVWDDVILEKTIEQEYTSTTHKKVGKHINSSSELNTLANAVPNAQVVYSKKQQSSSKQSNQDQLQQYSTDSVSLTDSPLRELGKMSDSKRFGVHDMKNVFNKIQEQSEPWRGNYWGAQATQQFTKQLQFGNNYMTKYLLNESRTKSNNSSKKSLGGRLVKSQELSRKLLPQLDRMKTKNLMLSKLRSSVTTKGTTRSKFMHKADYQNQSGTEFLKKWKQELEQQLSVE